ncbi:phosphoribosyltransferase domain-containing protein [Pendulispora rubella]|uniref:Phosphoribosyltransferase domain-containing protein n=1 Tax=Pendulispora rubella TaxID=2741070 RepID=A0ABZ2LFQ5_9BACT
MKHSATEIEPPNGTAPDRPTLALTYEHFDRWIESLQPALLAERFTMVIGILRGGAPLALMASHATGAPVAFLRYERQTRAVAWDSTLPLPPAGSKVLLCEDIAGYGFTLRDCLAFLQQQGLVIKTLTGVVDDRSATQPDFAIDARGYAPLLPWERQARTELHRADWSLAANGYGGKMREDHEYATYAIDLDGILLPDVPKARYEEDLEAALSERDELLPFDVFPHIDLASVRLIITGRPEIDRARTEAWLARHGFSHMQIEMRVMDLHDETPSGAAAHKAAAALRRGITHFIESEAVQALQIAQLAPLLRVIWWDPYTQTGALVGAHAWKP